MEALREAEAQGLRDDLVVLVGSDFARGPNYNNERDTAGKDHWSIGSFLALGKGIKGKRVVGETTSEQRPRGLDPDTLQVSDTASPMSVEQIHLAFRQQLQLQGLGQDYPLAGSPLNLFG